MEQNVFLSMESMKSFSTEGLGEPLINPPLKIVSLERLNMKEPFQTHEAHMRKNCLSPQRRVTKEVVLRLSTREHTWSLVKTFKREHAYSRVDQA